MSIRILADTACDFDLAEYEKYNVEYVPLTLTLSDKVYKDCVDIDKDSFWETIVRTEEFAKTSQPSPNEFLSIFEDVEKNKDHMVVILLSSNLSGTFQSAQIAKDMIDYEHIYLVDSLSATFAARLLIEEAISMRNNDYSAIEIKNELDKLKSKLKLYAVLDTLEYLSKGGRISKSAASIGDLANLKPIITLDAEGKIEVVDKAIGKSRAYAKLYKLIASEDIDTSKGYNFAYSYDKENVTKLMNKCKDILTIDENRAYNLGPALGAHIGPNGFAIGFFRK